MKSWRFARLVLALCMVAGSLAGCGDSDTASEANTDSESTPETTDATEPTVETEPTVAPDPTASPEPTVTPVPTATPVPQATATPVPEPTAADSDDGLVDDGDIAGLNVDVLLAGLSLDDKQSDCADGLVGTSDDALRQNFIEQCLGFSRESLIFALRDIDAQVWDSLSEAEFGCIADEAVAIIDSGQADDDFAVIRGAANCGFYGRTTLQPLGLFSADTLACMDESAVGVAPADTTTAREVALALMQDCGTATDVETLANEFADEDALEQLLTEELDALEEDDIQELADAIFLTPIILQGMRLTPAEEECAMEISRSASDDAEYEDLLDLALQSCWDDERRFTELARSVLAPLGVFELTDEDVQCIRDAYAEAGRPAVTMDIEEVSGLIAPLPVRCKTLGRALGSIADLSQETVACVDANAADYRETAESEAEIVALLEFCATPEELAALGL